MSEWRVSKRRRWLKAWGEDPAHWSAHPAWVISYQGRDIAAYTKWDRAIAHVMLVHLKFGF